MVLVSRSLVLRLVALLRGQTSKLRSSLSMHRLLPRPHRNTLLRFSRLRLPSSGSNPRSKPLFSKLLRNPGRLRLNRNSRRLSSSRPLRLLRGKASRLLRLLLKARQSNTLRLVALPFRPGHNPRSNGSQGSAHKAGPFFSLEVPCSLKSVLSSRA